VGTHDFSLTGCGDEQLRHGTDRHRDPPARTGIPDDRPTGRPWYVDVDDLTDPQPDDPYWYGYYESQRAAIDAACQRIAALQLDRLTRISQQLLPRATSAA
jgi:hypothetical protein